MAEKNQNLLYNIYFSEITRNHNLSNKPIVHRVPFNDKNEAIVFLDQIAKTHAIFAPREENYVILHENHWNKIDSYIKELNLQLPELQYFADKMQKNITHKGAANWNLNISDLEFAEKLTGVFTKQGLYFCGYGTIDNCADKISRNMKGEKTSLFFDMETKHDLHNGYNIRISDTAYFKFKATYLKGHEGFTFDIGMSSKDDPLHTKLGIIKENEHYKVVPIDDGKYGIQLNQKGMNKLAELGLVNEKEMGINALLVSRYVPANGVVSHMSDAKIFEKAPKPKILQEKELVGSDAAIAKGYGIIP